ncbi:response regulator [Permianibacter sp. IMCC34836]|uniref:response regulator n=1 Tax=Permianibacter fluminis TaxID=2738515 RepID=UPI001557435A|nr:response regulator [Permianibacter fluminis]NQD38201.1 response regulator [Permianibacter fluminis]
MPLRSPVVLVLDDEPLIRMNLAAFLHDEGFRTQEAATAEEALELVAAEVIDLVLVDLRLPGLDGASFMLMAHQLRPGLRFLIHTGSAEFRLSAELTAIGLGHDDIFCKPLPDMAVLSRAISHRLAVSRRLF